MSQKYKSFTSKNSVVTDENAILPPDVKRVGYLRKLKRMKRRFFVLRAASPSGSARLEYYSSEKKWKSGGEPRRSIELSNCLNIGRKLHSKQRNVLALYTREDCFSIVTETPEELELWLEDMLAIQKCVFTFNENKGITLFEHLWQVNIEKHDLEYNEDLSGPYLVALSSKALTLIKMDPSSNFDCLEFPLMSIRRCGHSKDFFFIELGRSAITGAGEIFMSTEGTIVAQNMHETVLGAMKSSKVREDGNNAVRPRSASICDNSNPVSMGHPVGMVALQNLPTGGSNTLSSSRERCDSLPTRPKTLNENSHNMVFSPFSLSSNNGLGSSSEDVNSLKQSSSCYSQSKSSEGILSERPLSEVPDEYFPMSPSEESKKSLTGYMLMHSETTSIASSDTISYMDMKSSKSDVSISIPKKPDSYMFMVQADSKQNPSANAPEGYLDMSPSSKSNLQNFNEISSLERNKNRMLNVTGNFNLEKVSAFVKNDDHDKRSEPQKRKGSGQGSIEMTINHPLILRANHKIRCDDIPTQQANCKENGNFSTKPPIPERTYRPDKVYSGPPVPGRPCDHLNSSAKAFPKVDNFNCKLKYAQDEPKQVLAKHEGSEYIQVEENSVFDEPVMNAHPRNSNSSSSIDQNTNFSCLAQSEKCFNVALPCAPVCSAQQLSECFSEDQGDRQSDSRDAYMGMQSENNPQLQNASKIQANQNAAPANLFPKPSNQNIVLPAREVGHSCGDYVNLDFKSSTSSNLCVTPSSSIVSSRNTHFFPNPQTDANYSNIHFGKPFCPTPNPTICDGPIFGGSLKLEKRYKLTDQNAASPNGNNNPATESSYGASSATDRAGELLNITPSKVRNIPNLFPAFRKQMSAPVAPVSLRPELTSPGRKSSCPVTTSGSAMKPTATVTPVRPVMLLLQGATQGHLRVSASRSPEHSSVSSVSSASDEISSNHSSPKVLSTSQSLGAPKNASDSYYENVVIAPQRPASRPSSVSSEKELNYASLDLAPSAREDIPRSPLMQKAQGSNDAETLQYAQIDFTKSEGLKNTTGLLRDSRP